MKNNRYKREFKEQRDEDLLSVFREVYSKSPIERRLDEILTEVVNHKTKRFWLSSERASIVISQIKKGCDISYMKKHKQLMFQEIYKRLLELEKIYPDKCILHLLEMIVIQEAPSFYLSPASASVILHYMKKRQKCLKRK